MPTYTFEGIFTSSIFGNSTSVFIISLCSKRYLRLLISSSQNSSFNNCNKESILAILIKEFTSLRMSL